MLLGQTARAGGQGILQALMGRYLLGEGHGTERTTGRDHVNTRFSEADVIGHPLLSLSGLWTGTGLLCQSESRPLFPYFLSALDVIGWRFGLPETVLPQYFLPSTVPGLREIGRWPFNTWGAVYPRTGFLIQAESPKAAAVAAQRAGDIVTRRRQPHVYHPVSGGMADLSSFQIIDNWVEVCGENACNWINRWFPRFRGQRVWRPPPLQERGATDRPARRSGLWQMLTPRVQGSCEAFGANDATGLGSWSSGKVDAADDYAWNLWRPYRCCRRRGQWFLSSFDFLDYPP